MRVLLINICLRPYLPHKIFPIGLSYIAGAIHRASYDLEILDIDVNRYSDEEAERRLRKKQFDVVGFGCIVTGYKIVKGLSQLVKSINKDAVIIVGNSVASSIPEMLLSKTEVDIVVVGEGDITIVEVLDRLEGSESLEGVEGIYYKQEGKIIASPPRKPIDDIDSIPFPPWDLFDIEKYIAASSDWVDEPYPIPKESIRELSVNTARGCLFNCTFCYHVFRDNRFRARSPQSVVNEIKELQRRYDINYVFMSDEMTLYSRKQAEEFADCFLSNNLNIYWAGDCRANLFRGEDVEIARKLKKSGCVILEYSLESGNRGILKAMNKKLTPEEFVTQVKVLNQAGIVSCTSLVFGYPQETIETIRETFSYCYDNDLYPSVGYLLPQPGTPMYDLAIERGLIRDEEEYLLNMGDRQDLNINFTNMPSEVFGGEIKQNLIRLRDKFGLPISEEHLIKTVVHKSPEKFE